MYLILFDIDGTLVLTGRAGWRAMNRACADEVGHDEAMRGVEFAGRTDWSILRDVMANHGKPLEQPLLDRLNRRYVAHLAEEIQLPGTGVKDVMPGVRELIAALERRDDVALGLLTGKFGDGARIKLDYFDLWKHFPVGAFGGDSPDRNELVLVAIQRARAAGPADVEPSRVIVIGHTPNHVQGHRAPFASSLVPGASPPDPLHAHSRGPRPRSVRVGSLCSLLFAGVAPGPPYTRTRGDPDPAPCAWARSARPIRGLRSSDSRAIILPGRADTRSASATRCRRSGSRSGCATTSPGPTDRSARPVSTAARPCPRARAGMRTRSGECGTSRSR